MDFLVAFQVANDGVHDGAIGRLGADSGQDLKVFKSIESRVLITEPECI
jgi:hypothetical protein